MALQNISMKQLVVNLTRDPRIDNLALQMSDDFQRNSNPASFMESTQRFYASKRKGIASTVPRYSKSEATMIISHLQRTPMSYNSVSGNNVENIEDHAEVNKYARCAMKSASVVGVNSQNAAKSSSKLQQVVIDDSSIISRKLSSSSTVKTRTAENVSSQNERILSTFGLNRHEMVVNRASSSSNRLQPFRRSKTFAHRRISNHFSYSSDESSSDDNYCSDDDWIPRYESSGSASQSPQRSPSTSTRTGSRNTSNHSYSSLETLNNIGESTYSSALCSTDKKLSTKKIKTRSIKKPRIKKSSNIQRLCRDKRNKTEAKMYFTRSRSSLTTKPINNLPNKFKNSTPNNAKQSKTSRNKLQIRPRSSSSSESDLDDYQNTQSAVDSRKSRQFQMTMKSIWVDFETNQNLKQKTQSASKFRNSWPNWSNQQVSNFMKMQSRVNSMMPRYFSSNPDKGVDVEAVIAALTKH